MNALAPRNANAIALHQHLPEPPLPRPVADHLDRLKAHAAERAAFAAATERQREEMFVAAPPALPALRPDERAEVVRGVEYLERHTGPVTMPQLAAWLAPINAAVRNPQSREDLQLRVAALHELLADLPAGCFTQQARRDLKPEWFPSAGEIRAVVEPGARQMRATLDALRRLAAPPKPAEPEPDRMPRTPEEIAAVQAKAREAIAALRAQEVERAKVPAKALPLSDGAMLAHYRRLAAEGNAAAAFRAAQIEQRLGLDA
jgi:hypothetical protein